MIQASRAFLGVARNKDHVFFSGTSGVYVMCEHMNLQHVGRTMSAPVVHGPTCEQAYHNVSSGIKVY